MSAVPGAVLAGVGPDAGAGRVGGVRRLVERLRRRPGAGPRGGPHGRRRLEPLLGRAGRLDGAGPAPRLRTLVPARPGRAVVSGPGRERPAVRRRRAAGVPAGRTGSPLRRRPTPRRNAALLPAGNPPPPATGPQLPGRGRQGAGV